MNEMMASNYDKESYAVIADEETYTYKQLRELAECMQMLFDGKGLVFHVCSNTIGGIAGYAAIYRCGQVQMLLEEDISDDILRRLLALYHPGYLYIQSSRCSYYPEWEMIIHIKEYVLLKTDFETNYGIYGDLALLLTTSGSTGSRKYVRLSYQNVYANAQSIAEYLEVNQSERPVLLLPMHYSYGLSIINSHLLKRATLLLTGKNIFQKEFWAFFGENKATSISGTPYVYEILQKTGFLYRTLPSLKVMTQAGGKLPETLHKAFAVYAEEKGIRFFVMYGQTEATARISYLPYQKAAAKCGSIGIAIPGGRMALTDDNGKEIEGENVVGEILYQGENVSLGYAEGYQDLCKGDERNGTLYTGDMGKRDKDGFYYVVGRKKRFLKIYGKRISLDEVEELIRQQFSMIGCCCCGTDDRLTIVLDKADEKVHKIVKEYLVAKIKVPYGAITTKYIEEIPRTTSGKIDYNRIE